MNKQTLPWHVLTLVVLVLPTLYLLAVASALPAQVPTHFGLDGQPNGYTAREWLWLLTTALPLGIYLLMTVLPYIDPKRRLEPNNVNLLKLRLLLVGLAGGLGCFVLYAGQHPEAQPDRWLVVGLGLAFALMGNYLTTVPPNYFVGIKSPWALENPLVWARTHRLAGWLFFGAGLLTAGLGLVLPVAWAHYTLAGLLLSSAAFSYAYSFYLFQQEQQRFNSAE